MKAKILKPNASAVVGLLLAIPTTYFILINILNEAGVTASYNAAQPLLEKLGSNNPLGWDINLLIVFGPLIALLLNVSSVLNIHWHATKTDIDLQLHIAKRWSNFFVVGLSALCLCVLFLYLFGENCS
jgi:hypothetical protein